MTRLARLPFILLAPLLLLPASALLAPVFELQWPNVVVYPVLALVLVAIGAAIILRERGLPFTATLEDMTRQTTQRAATSEPRRAPPKRFGVFNDIKAAYGKEIYTSTMLYQVVLIAGFSAAFLFTRNPQTAFVIAFIFLLAAHIVRIASLTNPATRVRFNRLQLVFVVLFIFVIVNLVLYSFVSTSLEKTRSFFVAFRLVCLPLLLATLISPYVDLLLVSTYQRLKQITSS